VRKRILIRKYGLRGIGSGDRIIDRVARITGGSELVCQRCQMRPQVVLMNFLDRCANLGV
jgi:hypothetical protein